MHEELWAGADLKIKNAGFFFEEMGRSLQPPERTAMNVIQQSTGAIIGKPWERPFYANLDAFLAMARSVPDIIQWCFGEDSTMKMKTRLKPWFDTLSPSEQAHRRDFSTQFKTHYDEFCSLALTTARNITLHRKGYPSVEVKITGRFGVYTGSPVQHVPGAETRPIYPSDDPADPAVQWAGTLPPISVRPMWDDFKIDGNPLCRECQAYLDQAQKLVAQARDISLQIHGNDTLTSPP